ncbi:MAG: DivIVA domain-containing protein [Bacillota bacterium]
MDLTPEEIADKEFDKSFALWSYDDTEVKEFLELVSIGYEEVLVKNKKLKEEMNDMKSDFEEQQQQIKRKEQQAEKVKKEAEQEAEKIIKNAQEEAQNIKDQAELKAERIINQSKKRVRKVVDVEKKIKSDFEHLFTFLLKSLKEESDLENIEEKFNQLLQEPEDEEWNVE